MDHLPSPQSPRFGIQIPYLGGQEYDNLGFEGFPERNGWTVDQLSALLKAPDSKIGDRAYIDALSFLQSWLFFGTLGRAFGMNGIKINTGDYIRHEQGEQEGTGNYITTSRLLSHIAEYVEIEKRFSPQTRYQRMLPAIQFFDHVCRTAWSLDETVGDRHEVLWGSILLSVTVLCNSLRFLIYGLSVWTSSGRHFLGKYMERAGWCPNRVAMINDVYTETTAYYIYTLGPPSRGKDHSRCSWSVCAANQIDEASYETLHQRPGCQCEFVELPLDKIESICEAGGIPLVSVMETASEESPFVYGIEPHRPGIPYIAFSHVWSDGLGNPHTNALWKCQMKALSARTQALLLPEHKSRSGGGGVLLDGHLVRSASAR
jgi:hypothetical protein